MVLSPAYEDPRMVLTSLATDLASHGYVVALVGHTFEDSGETLANGQTPPCAICDDPARLDFDSVAASRALDVSFVIDQLTHGNTAWRLAHLIDKHEIGMAGHSLGGAAAAATMIADPRVLAGVNMDGAFHPAPMPGQINRPFLMLGAAANHPVSRRRHHVGADLGRPRRLQEVADGRRRRPLQLQRPGPASGGGRVPDAAPLPGTRGGDHPRVRDSVLRPDAEGDPQSAAGRPLAEQSGSTLPVLVQRRVDPSGVHAALSGLPS
ncbi:hypothetical protein HEP87_56525 [Streptomyces sp. S1D4-11]